MTTTFSAPDIECGGCAHSIKTALAKTDGVQSVDVDIEKKTVTVAHTAPATPETLLQRLDAVGFPATVVVG
jgi:copper chaperone